MTDEQIKLLQDIQFAIGSARELRDEIAALAARQGAMWNDHQREAGIPRILGHIGRSVLDQSVGHAEATVDNMVDTYALISRHYMEGAAFMKARQLADISDADMDRESAEDASGGPSG